jgi:hypothetical protein
MKTLSPTPVVAEYVANEGKECLLGKYVVTVVLYERNSQSGSYDRGFKWTDTTYGYLTRQLKGTKYYKPMRYSPDHGATWYESLYEAKKQRAGKVKVAVRKSQEFAFQAIQKINKEYDPRYNWKA